jgi:hypothetical protein
MVEGCDVENEVKRMGSDAGLNTTVEHGEVFIGSRDEAHRLYWEQFLYYTISRAFIDIPDIICIAISPDPQNIPPSTQKRGLPNASQC